MAASFRLCTPGDVNAILAERDDVPADEVAAHVRAQFTLDSPLEGLERWSNETGTTLSRSCAGMNGERRFATIWRILASDPLATLDWSKTQSGSVSDPCATLFPYALMRMLRRERQLVADLKAQQLRTTFADPIDHQSVFARMIGMELKKWAKPIALVHELGLKLRNTTEFEGVPLIIGQSTYHEERILARLACDLFLTVHGYAGLQIAQAPWEYGRTVTDILRPVIPGGADIRLVNKDIADATGDVRSSNENSDHAVIFRHLGYRAYANGAWLARILAGDEPAPEPVREWIDRVKGAGSAADPSLFDPDSFPARVWLLVKGKPVSFRNTEFGLLFDFLFRKFRRKARFDPPPIEISESKVDPDELFDEFLRGKRHVLFSGSIHDILVEAPLRCLDLCCGTGLFFSLLAPDLPIIGYGFDRSKREIEIAQNRSIASSVRVNFRAADVVAADYPTEIDFVTINFDALNHIRGASLWRQVFQKALRSLIHGGVLLFDINLPKRLAQDWNQPEVIVKDDVSYIQIGLQPRLRAATITRRIGMVVFSRGPDGRFARATALIEQFAMPVRDILALLQSVGFRHAKVIVANGDDPVGHIFNKNRAFILASK